MNVTWTTETKTDVGVAPKPPSPAQKQLSKEEVTKGIWELDPNLKLRHRAAEFYLMMDLDLDGLDGGKFQKLMDYLLPQFVAYTDMAVGGELRHSRAKVPSNQLPTPLRRALADSTLPSNRWEAWRGWHRFRKHYGTLALEWAEEVFPSFSGGGFGGKKWANIASILRMYETDDLTPLMFVDTCWGLQHNGGAYFDKAWTTKGLKSVLDANLAESIPGLLYYATAPVRNFYNKKRNGGADI